MPSSQLESIFNTLQDGIIACDREGRILQVNEAALRLFEVAAEYYCRGKLYAQFLQSFAVDHGQGRAVTLEPWVISLVFDGEVATWLQQEPVVLQVPSGRKYSIIIRRLPVHEALEQDITTVYVFHDITYRYQRILHIQRVHRSLSTLREAIARIPEHLDFAFPEGIFLLSPPVLYVSQQLVDLVGQVLDCQHVSLLAFGSQAGHLHYAVGSGFTSEQEQYRREVSGSLLPSDFLDETVLARLAADQEVILPAYRLRLPSAFKEDSGRNNFLLVPMILENQLSGALVVVKAGMSSEYTPEEIELVKAVAAETSLVIACLRFSYEKAESEARMYAQQEMYRLIDGFLNLASHELQTPLTVIKGNIQLAQRHLAILKHRLARQSELVGQNIEWMQDFLTSADQSTRHQGRLIKDFIDVERIQSNTLELHVQHCDLIALLREAVAVQQQTAHEHAIVLDVESAQATVPIIADAQRIRQVIAGYLMNALSYSPADKPVTVRLTVEQASARVSVRDEGPGIPLEEQGRIWGRFYYAKRTPAHQESDQRFGLGLYLCQALIERHHGSVGVQSEPGHGATFWFTLPIDTSAD